MIFPKNLKKGDKIAIISPATIVDERFIDGAVDLLSSEGYSPIVMPHAKGPASGSFASSEENRLADLRDALHNQEIKAILCARGGYGSVHLLPYFSDKELRDNAKWIIGFSDISALHALWQRAGVASIHGPMAKHLTLQGSDDVCTRKLLDLLSDENPFMLYSCDPHPFNRNGETTGRLVGGNLAVLNGLSGTNCDLLATECEDGIILFIEDISEAIYAVERMLMRLGLAGVFNRLRGLIIGQFTEYRPDRNFPDMESMIDSLLSRKGITGIPVAFNFPVGHVTRNFPLVEGAMVNLTVTPDEVVLKTLNS